MKCVFSKLNSGNKSAIIIFGIVVQFLVQSFFTLPVYSQAPDTLWSEDWEGSWSTDWHITYGTWEVGTPTSGPGGAHSGQKCAATILNGNYGDNVDSTRLVRHTPFVVPPSSENPRLRFWQWYDFRINDNDYGKVQIKVSGSETWEDLSDGFYHNRSGGIWYRPYLDLSAYAGLSVQIAFYFHSDGGYTAAGWYLDDVTIETGTLAFKNPEDWESGYDDWYVDYGTWELGEPSSGPGSAWQGTNCMATKLDGNYYDHVDSTRLISPPFTVPSAQENPRLRFWQWYDFRINDNDYGKVQIKVSGSETWEDLSDSFYHDRSGGIWTRPYLDLSAYSGLSVQIAFYFHSDGGYTAAGWYLDDVSIETGTLVFNNPEDWESGYDDWYVDYGTWEVGKPSSGPGSAYEGTNCAATKLDGNYYDDVDSTRLISPPFTVPSAQENPVLRFWNWYYFRINDDDYGEVQIRNIESGTAWITLKQYRDKSTIWFEDYIPLSDYVDSRVQISFYFHSDGGYTEAGWYVDSIAIVGYKNPLIVVEPDSIDFGNVFVDSTKYDSVTVSNTGNDTLHIESIFISGYNPDKFGVDSALFNLAPDESRKLAVSFIPDTSGTFNAKLNIKSDGGDEIVYLSGIGIEIVGIEDVTANKQFPSEIKLWQNYPNPFNPLTQIKFGLPKESKVKLEFYNALGQKVATLLNTHKPAGYHEVTFNGSKLASGVYYYRIWVSNPSDQAKNFVQVKKMLLVK